MSLSVLQKHSDCRTIFDVGVWAMQVTDTINVTETMSSTKAFGRFTAIHNCWLFLTGLVFPANGRYKAHSSEITSRTPVQHHTIVVMTNPKIHSYTPTLGQLEWAIQNPGLPNVHILLYPGYSNIYLN